MVHAVLAARSGMKEKHHARRRRMQQQLMCTKRQETGDSPTAEAQTRAGEVLIGKEAAVSYKLTCNLPIKALTQRLWKYKGREEISHLMI